MAHKLVVVESPTKARTIRAFLGPEFVVEPSVGHIRDLPGNASEIPKKYREKPWARLGVDVDNDFQPIYVVPESKRRQVRALREKMEDAAELILATDEDREGESIAWHVTEVLRPQVPVRRMVFHEITRSAIEEALANTRDLDQQLVDAQEARRILDRLVGYEVSPVLWRRVRSGLSAGRVQSPAIRLVVERERARIAFVAAGYWSLRGVFVASGEGFSAVLVRLDGARVATGRDFDAAGAAPPEVVVLDEDRARALAAALEGRPATVTTVERKPYRRRPAAPFRTSTLQQEAGRKLRFAAARTMAVAQRLYENGYITYMRTDSTTLAASAVASARAQVASLFGSEYLPDKPRAYTTKARGAQEAHEAIRPAGEVFRLPEEVAGEVDGDAARLYDLIWKRTLASQMKDAVGERVQIVLAAETEQEVRAEFAATGTVIDFPGFMRVYVEDRDEEPDDDDEERRLPRVAEGDHVDAEDYEPRGHETKPPARFTEASLVRRLEELGIGRPSTYASILSTIQDRGYVWKRAQALIPSLTAFATVGLLENHFSDLVDYAFTARMEDDLDRIAAGEQDHRPWLGRFYFGNGDPGLRALVSEQLEEIDAREVNTISIGDDRQGVAIVARVGRYGPYLERGDDRASLPDDLPPDELTVEVAEELLDAPSRDRVLGTDPDSGATIVARSGRFGPYVAREAEDGGRPVTQSLFKSMDLKTVTLEDALRLLSLPRVVGVDPGDGVEITAQNGRYGPYVKKGSESRSLQSEEEIFEVTLEDALALLAQPRSRGRRNSPPLREVGADPDSGRVIVVRNGRYGPYVTDGEVNASLRTGDTPEGIDLDRARELLAARRDRMAAGKKKPRKK